MTHPSDKITLENVDDLFNYKKPTPVTQEKYTLINKAAVELARTVLTTTPDCRFRDWALMAVVLARMLSNAAIATAPEHQEGQT